ncbi:MAG: hypothetical protein COA99_19575 [Moraxellaceae bacterium]|nr:MAG: hypothetical protein COA99_19575 [Moraxellaceae bacterium]
MNKSKNLHELYADFGMAAEKAQVLEIEAGNVVLSFVSMFVDPKTISSEDKVVYKKLVDEVDRKTLGNLLRKIRNIVEFDPSYEEVISEALRKRNYLVHGFFKTHNFAIFDETGQIEMRKELSDISKQMDVAHRHLAAISLLLEKLAGREECSTEKADKLMKLGKAVKI